MPRAGQRPCGGVFCCPQLCALKVYEYLPVHVQLRYQVEQERERERQHCDEEIARMSSIDRAMSTLGYNDRTNFASYPGVPRGPGRPWTERAAMGLEEGACGGQESLAVVGEARPSASDDKAVHGLVPSDMR